MIKVRAFLVGKKWTGQELSRIKLRAFLAGPAPGPPPPGPPAARPPAPATKPGALVFCNGVATRI